MKPNYRVKVLKFIKRHEAVLALALKYSEEYVPEYHDEIINIAMKEKVYAFNPFPSHKIYVWNALVKNYKNINGTKPSLIHSKSDSR